MKRRACVLLTVVNILLIAINIIVIPYIYKGVYKTHVFWGINLYVATSTVLMLINKGEKMSFVILNSVLTALSFIWLILYMPKFTPAGAVKYLSSLDEFKSAKVYQDASNPVNSERASFFIKGKYNIIVERDPDNKEHISFNPRSGAYKALKSTGIKSTLVSDFFEYAEFDQDFLDRLNAATGDSNKIRSLLMEYRNKYAEEMVKYYNLIMELFNEEEKEAFRQDQAEWRSYLLSHKNFIEDYYSNKDGGIYISDIPALESECYQYKSRASSLKYMYNKLSVGQ